MPLAYSNADGQKVKCCPRCGEVKLATEENWNRNPRTSDQFFSWCRICESNRKQQDGDAAKIRGIEIKHEFIRSVGSKCQHPGCHMQYPDDLPGNFDLDHIDPRLKRKRRETEPGWMARHEQEFWERVAPNLRLLCCHHHRLITAEQARVGGVIHQILHGTADPANLFNIPQDNHPVLFEWKASGGAACPTL
jgi:hypothetical protein